MWIIFISCHQSVIPIGLQPDAHWDITPRKLDLAVNGMTESFLVISPVSANLYNDFIYNTDIYYHSLWNSLSEDMHGQTCSVSKANTTKLFLTPICHRGQQHTLTDSPYAQVSFIPFTCCSS